MFQPMYGVGASGRSSDALLVAEVAEVAVWDGESAADAGAAGRVADSSAAVSSAGPTVAAWGEVTELS
ncbi:hypothetical protein DY218_31885 [Streptomyces triticagri]|uniref:Uncharacterized protein n=1 Tax=Streptomyces triticagri TaxID=2293568 RepID=A0A372LVD5_9ACTN|nr:hypothetical protein DY218_31885 [Streptomyces triticagri]